MSKSNVTTVLSESLEVMDNIESGNTCPMFGICRDFLDPGQFIECAKRQNLCSKSEMVTKKMLHKLLENLK